jgi:putative hydrolase of the HAD superfamily
MEVPELLDLVERVAGGVDALVTQSYEEGRLEELNQADLLRQSFAAIGFDLPDDVIDHIVQLDHSAYSNSLSVGPDVRAALEELRADGYRMGLVSNISLRADLMRDDLGALGLDRFLDASVFSSEVGIRKPDPRIFREALARVGAEPAAGVFVGDRLVDDVSGARAVGMRGVQTRQFRQESDPDIEPDAVIDRLDELRPVLAEWGGPPGGESGRS